MQEMRVPSLGQEDSLEKEMESGPAFLLEVSHGQRSLAGYSPWGRKRVGHNLVTKQPPFITLVIHLWKYFQNRTHSFLFMDYDLCKQSFIGGYFSYPFPSSVWGKLY